MPPSKQSQSPDPAVQTLVSAYKPKKFEEKLQGITFNKDGDLLLTTSCLTGRYWTSSVFYFTSDTVNKSANASGDATAGLTVATALAGSELEDGVGDALFITPKDILVGLDSGVLEHLRVAPPDGDSAFHYVERLAAVHDQDGPVHRLRRSPDGKKVVAASADGSVLVLESETFRASAELRPAHTGEVWDVDVSGGAGTGLMASASEDGLVAFWDERKSEGKDKFFVSKISFGNSPPRAVSFIPDNDNLVVVGQENGTVSLYDIRESGKALHTHLTSEENFGCSRICFSPKRPDVFALTTESCSLRQFSVEGGSRLREVASDEAHDDFVKGVAWNPTDDKLWSCGWDKKIRVR